MKIRYYIGAMILMACLVCVGNAVDTLPGYDTCICCGGIGDLDGMHALSFPRKHVANGFTYTTVTVSMCRDCIAKVRVNGKPYYVPKKKAVKK